MYSLGSFNINNFSSSQPLVLTSGVGYEYVRIINKSPLALSVNIQGMGTINYPEFFLEDIFLPKSFLGGITITPHQDITSVGHGVSGTVAINMYNHGEISRPQAQPLAQPAVTTTATGKPVFSATIGFTTVTSCQQLNIFNPANSGVVATIHSARAFSNSANNPTINLMYNSGADNNFATPVAAVSHTGSLTPPISILHCTGVDSCTPPLTTIIETINLTQGVTAEMISFPDTYLLFPGGNLELQLNDSVSGKLVHLTYKWTEDTIVPPVIVTGPSALASSVVNDNNPSGTTVLEATASGDSPSDVLIQNNGTGTFKGLLTAAATIINGLLTANSGIKTTGSTSPAIDTSASTGAIALKLLVGSVSRVSVFTGSASTAGNLAAHGLGVKPDWVGLIENNTAGDSNNFAWDVAASDATNVKIWGNNATARSYTALAVKL